MYCSPARPVKVWLGKDFPTRAREPSAAGQAGEPQATPETKPSNSAVADTADGVGGVDMRISSIVTCGALVACLLGTMAFTASAPAGAQERQVFSVAITYDVDPPEDYRLCPIKVAFTAVVVVKNWHPGMPQTTLTYHWEHGTKQFKDHTMTVGEQGQSNFFRFHESHGFRGHVAFVITKPYRFAQDSGALDILCH